MSVATSLWNDLCALLRGRGELPFQLEVMTPAEVASAVRHASGDGRVQNFVWNYFYPRHYGAADGELSEAEAMAIVHSFKSPAMPPTEATLADDEPRDHCGICHARPARGRG